MCGRQRGIEFLMGNILMFVSIGLFADSNRVLFVSLSKLKIKRLRGRGWGLVLSGERSQMESGYLSLADRGLAPLGCPLSLVQARITHFQMPITEYGSYSVGQQAQMGCRVGVTNHPEE